MVRVGDVVSARKAIQQAYSWMALDSVCFGPILSMATDVYKETPLEDKLTSVMNKFETDHALKVPGQKSLGGVELTGERELVSLS